MRFKSSKWLTTSRVIPILLFWSTLPLASAQFSFDCNPSVLTLGNSTTTCTMTASLASASPTWTLYLNNNVVGSANNGFPISTLIDAPGTYNLMGVTHSKEYGNTSSSESIQVNNAPILSDEAAMAEGSSHLQYFGFFAGGSVDQIPTLSTFSNIAWVDAFTANDSSWLQAVLAAVSNGQKIMLVTSAVFFDANKNLLPANQYQQNWNAVLSTLGVNAGDVAALYPMDEPYVSLTDATSIAQRKSDVETAISVMKQSMPSTPVAVIFDASTVANPSEYPIPAGYDWIGFDCYQNWYDCPVGGGESIPLMMSSLRARLTPTQKLIVIPDAMLVNGSTLNQQTLDSLRDRIDRYYSYAASDPKVIGLFPFVYQSGISWTGASQIPQALNRYQKIGKMIVDASIYLPWSSASTNNPDESPGWTPTNLIDGNLGTDFSTAPVPGPDNTSGVYVQATLNSPQRIESVSLGARTTNGVVYCFPPSYHILVQPQGSSDWVDEGVFTTQPDSSLYANVLLPHVITAQAIKIEPVTLSTDPFGNYYLQLSEIDVHHGPPINTYQWSSAVTSYPNLQPDWAASYAIDGRLNTAFSTAPFASNTNTTQTFAAWFSAQETFQELTIAPRTLGDQAYGFPQNYQLSVTTPDNSSWIDVGNYSNQPGPDGFAHIVLPEEYSTWGIMITPTTLTTDPSGNYYFQVAEIGAEPAAPSSEQQ